MCILLLSLTTLVYGRILADSAYDFPVEAMTLNAGSSGVLYRFHMQLQEDVEAGDFLKIEFPSDYSDIGFSPATTCQINGAAHPCTKEGLNTVSIEAASELSYHHRLQVDVPNIDNPASEGPTGYFKAYVEFAATARTDEANEAFGSVHVQPAFASTTGTLSISTDKVGNFAELTTSFIIATDIDAGTTFRVTVPSPFTIPDDLTCEAVDYDINEAAVQGSFECEVDEQMIWIEGLNEALVIGDGVSFKFTSILNPAYEYAASQASFVVESLQPGINEVIDSASIDNPAIQPADVTEVTLSEYFAFAKFSQNNELFTRLNFTIENEVPDDGSIEIDYVVTPSDCFIESGPTTDSTFACSISGTTAEITGFNTIPAGTSIVVVAALTVGTSTLTGVTVTTLTADSDIIDTGTCPDVALESFAAFSLAVAYSGNAGDTGSLTLTLSPTTTAAAGATFDLFLPEGFSLPSGDSMVCTADGDGSPETIPCSLSGQQLTMTTVAESIGAGSEFVITTTGSGLQYAYAPSSEVNPIEFSLQITHTDLSVEYATCSTTLPFGEFDGASVEHLDALDMWSEFEFSVPIDVDLLTTDFEVPEMIIEFETHDGSSNAFPIDLGTGLTTDSAIPCTAIDFENFSEDAPLTCTLSPAASQATGNPAVVTFAQFADYAAGSEIQFSLYLRTSEAVTSPVVTVRTQKTNVNGYTIILQETNLAVSFSAPTGTWSTLSATALSNNLVYSLASMTLTLQTTSSATATGDILVISLPEGFTFASSFSLTLGGSSATVEKVESDYAPALRVTLTSGALSNTVSTEVVLTDLVNAPHEDAGIGDIEVSILQGTSVIEHDSAGTLAGSSADALNVTVEPANLYRDFPDAAIKFTMQNIYELPSSGQITVEFPAGFDVGAATCSYSFELTGTKTCSTSGQVVTITGFDTILADTQFYVKIWTIVTPDQDSSGEFIISLEYDTSGAAVVETFTDPGYTFDAAVTPGEAVVYVHTFFPSNAGTTGDFFLEFALEAPVPLDGYIEITFPAEYTLPGAMDATNCLFNQLYDSCAVASNVLTIDPTEELLAGVYLTLEIPDLTVPSTVDPIEIRAWWNTHEMIAQPTVNISAEYYFTAGAASATALTASLDFYPTNANSKATFDITITASVDISTTDQVYIGFPAEFPEFVGDVIASSASSSNADDSLSVTVSEDDRYILLTDFEAITAGTSFTVSVSEVINPDTVGATSAFVIGIMDEADAFTDYSNTETVTTTARASNLPLVSISVTDATIQATTDYSFVLAADPFSTAKEIWIRFPDHQYFRALLGLGETYSCSLYQVDETTSATSTLTTDVTCTNPTSNFILVDIQSGTLSAGYYLNVVLHGVKTGNEAGETKPFLVTLYDPTTKAIDQITYIDTTNEATLDLVYDKQDLFIVNALGTFEVGVGMIETLEVFTGSEYHPAKTDLSLTYTIVGEQAASGITFSPNPVMLPVGASSATFTIQTTSSTTEGVYYIKWTVSGDNYDMYLEPVFSELTINPSKQYSFEFDLIPALLPGFAYGPMYLTLEVAPIVPISFEFTLPVGVELNNIEFEAGQTVSAYSIFINDTVVDDIYFLEFTIQGDTYNIFDTASDTLSAVVLDYDIEVPELTLVEVVLPKERLSQDLVVQATEPSALYYTYGERGLAPPDLTEMIELAVNASEGYYTEYIDGSYSAYVHIENLEAEHDYILYGALMDLHGFVAEDVFSINLYTAEYYDSVIFSLKFNDPAPDTATLESAVIDVLAQQFVLSEVDRLQHYGSGADNVEHFVLYNDPTSTLPSPMEMVAYTVNPQEINKFLADYSLSIDEDFSIYDSIAIVENNRPEWVQVPVVDSQLKDELNFTMIATTSGKAYVVILSEGSIIPSSRQVTLGVDAFNEPFADYWYPENITAYESLTVSYGGLDPATSYTIVITVENDNERLPRVMSDDYMFRIDVITQAEGTATILVESAALLSLVLSVLLIV